MQSSTGIESSAFSDSKPGNKSGNNPDDDSNGKSGGGPDGKRENHGLQAMTQRSQLFAGLMERFEDNQSLSILDVGPGVAESVDFFAGRRCRLYFADLFDRLPLAQLVRRSFWQRGVTGEARPRDCRGTAANSTAT